MNEQVFYQEMPSPIGTLTLISNTNALTAVHMEGGDFVLPAGVKKGHAVLGDTRRQLEEYFAGRRFEFSLPMAAGGTPFQCLVWMALCDIPFAQTRSYADIARAVGNARAVRAVGAANGRNPISIIVPCHRVIGADGSLTGYGGGIERKRWLLEHEKRASCSVFRAS
jgi:methylated-DNA-[protein]-cysteine S-methyltransferase